jgi:DNA (cytosine-5)-methyltransferase 1
VKYLSVCSGIEAATCAWHHMGWEPVAFSEIEKFPSAVLAHHYPNVPNWGDMTKFKEWPDANVDVLVGGTPCQSFSVAGLRKGLDDPRGNLMLTYLAIAQRYRPQWLVWENVPGVLSSEGGRDFAALLRGLDELGYGWAYRVLDAQYFGVAQRRRRVFVVGYLGDWHRAAAVFFERHSLSGHPAPSRQARKGVAPGAASGTGTGGWPAEISPTLNAHFGSKQGLEDQHIAGGGDCLSPPVAMCLITKTRLDSETETLIPTIGGGFDAVAIQDVCAVEKQQNGRGWNDDGSAYTVGTHAAQGVAINIYGGNKRTDRPEGGFYVRTDENTSKTLDAASGLNPTCSQGGTAVLQPVAIQGTVIGRSEHAGPQGSGADDSGAMFTLTKADVHAVAQPVPYDFYQITAPINRQNRKPSDPCHTLARDNAAHATIVQPMQVRRLTAMECERLQGFPDGYTNIPWRNKPESPDGPRYKALGNSMAVPVMRWIGERINEVSKL